MKSYQTFSSRRCVDVKFSWTPDALMPQRKTTGQRCVALINTIEWFPRNEKYGSKKESSGEKRHSRDWKMSIPALSLLKSWHFRNSFWFAYMPKVKVNVKGRDVSDYPKAWSKLRGTLAGSELVSVIWAMPQLLFAGFWYSVALDVPFEDRLKFPEDPEP